MPNGNVTRRFLADNASNAAKIDLTDTFDFSSGILRAASPSGSTDVATKAYVDASSAGFEVLDDVIDGVNASSAPPTEVSGDRYIIVNASTPDAGWDGVITGNGDVVEFNGSSWTLSKDVSGVTTSNLLAWNTTDGIWNKFTGGGSTWTEHGGLAGVTAGSALTKSGNTLNVAVDDSSIEINADALRVKALGITNAMLAGSITAEKINKGVGLTDNAGNLELASGVAGAGLAIASQVLSVNVDDSSIELSSDTLQIKAGGVAAAMYANTSIKLGKLDVSGDQEKFTATASQTTFTLSRAVDTTKVKSFVVCVNRMVMDYKATPDAIVNYKITNTGGGGEGQIIFGSGLDVNNIVTINYIHDNA